MRYLRVISLLLAATLASPVANENSERGLDSCNNNLALSVVKALKATSFCSCYLKITTKTTTVPQTTTVVVPYTSTSTSIVTEPQTATTTEYGTATRVEQTNVAGPTTTITSTQTTTTVVTSVSTSTSSTTITQTTTSYRRNGGPLKRGVTANPVPTVPAQLKKYANSVISKACSCYVTTPTKTVTSTVTQTSTSTSVTVETSTTSPVVTTNTVSLTLTVTTTVTITSPTVTSTSTSTVTQTSTQVSTTTVVSSTTTSTTVPGPFFNYVANYNTNCVPFNYLELENDVAVNTYEQIFQFCANLCKNDPNGCVQIWVSYNTPAGGGRYWCLTGGGPDFKTWDSSEIQCQYPPIGQYANWYSVA